MKTAMKNRRITMYTGKGGVGKTTCAAATALHYSETGEKSLLISTDPTPSLSHIFEIARRHEPVAVAENLSIAELGMDEVRQMWDRKFGREVYQVFASFVDLSYPDFTDFVTTVLPGLQEEFMVDYIRELALSKRYDRLVWDTAPLGQTLGLLKMPSLISEHLKPAPRIYSKLKSAAGTRRSVLDIINGWAELSGQDVEFLRDEVRFVIVTIPEALAYAQIEGVFAEFREFGFEISGIVINNVAADPSSDFMRERADQQRRYRERIHQRYQHLDIVEVPMMSREIKGIERLRLIAGHLFSR